MFLQLEQLLLASFHRTRAVRRLMFPAAVTLLIALFTMPAAAAIIAVTTSDDELNADGDCSLREAISSANADTAIDACNAGAGVDEIILPSGTYRLSIEGAAEDAAATGDLDITSELTISGAGAATTVIDANMIDRVFHVDPSGSGIAATIRGVTIRGGATLLISYFDSAGGGILLGVPNTLGGTAPSGSLTLADCVVSDNTSVRSGGGIANKGGTLVLVNSRIEHNIGTQGGGIVNDGRLIVDGSTLSGNSSGEGGAIWSLFNEVTLANSTISGNQSTGFGGGISNYRSVIRVTNCTISGNSTLGSGGGIANLQGELMLNSSTVTDNDAVSVPGGILADMSGLSAALDRDAQKSEFGLIPPGDSDSHVDSRGQQGSAWAWPHPPPSESQS